MHWLAKVKAHLKALGEAKKLRRAIVSVQTILGFVAVAIALVIGALVIGYFQGAVNTSTLPTQAANAINNIFSTTWTAYGLLPIALIVGAAVVILSVVFYIRGASGAAE